MKFYHSHEEVERSLADANLTITDHPLLMVLWNVCYQLARVADKLSAIDHHGLKTINRG